MQFLTWTKNLHRRRREQTHLTISDPRSYKLVWAPCCWWELFCQKMPVAVRRCEHLDKFPSWKLPKTETIPLLMLCVWKAELPRHSEPLEGTGLKDKESDFQPSEKIWYQQLSHGMRQPLKTSTLHCHLVVYTATHSSGTQCCRKNSRTDSSLTYCMWKGWLAWDYVPFPWWLDEA